MNIIVLLESISLDKLRIGSFVASDFTEIKKQLIAQKEVHPEIEDSDIAQLMKALKSNATELQAVVNNRVLFNFFAKTDYPRTSFTHQAEAIDTEKVKAFVQTNFAEELNVFFNQNLEANKFDQISILAEAHSFFPDSLNFSLRQHALDKLDDATTALKPPYGNFSKIMYIKDSNFFVFLNHIKDEGIEARMESFFTTVKNFYNQNNGSELAGNSFSAMNKYSPIDKAFGEKIKNYKEVAENNVGNYVPKRRNLTWVYIVVGVFVLIRVVVFFSMNNFNNDDYNDSVIYDDESEYSTEASQIDSYYTNMKYEIDSFQTFLTSFKESEIKQMTRVSALKTGDNPFETFYENPPAGESSNFITITNKTGYDIVLLENAVMYDSIKMPRTAHFIKAGDALDVNFRNGNYSETVFNMYLGKKWATFQTESKHLFIRNHSIIEYRFSELVPDSKSILKTDYSFINDVIISYSKGGLDIDSPGAKINPLSR